MTNRYVEELRDENERLRNALILIRRCTFGSSAREIARIALRAYPPGTPQELLNKSWQTKSLEQLTRESTNTSFETACRVVHK